ncbi:MAG: nitrous oxide reductase family maturation protein NosD [Caldilineaceae bacterium]
MADKVVFSKSNLRNLRLSAFICLLFLLFFAVGGAAQENGFDLAAAMAAAQPGAVIDVPAGVYYGDLSVDKPLHLRGEIAADGSRPIIDGQGQGTVVVITAPDVILENFVIRNSGNVIDKEDGGITVEKAGGVQLLNNRLEDVLYGIRGIDAHRLVIRGNYITGKELDIARRGDGLRLWQSEECLVEGNTVERVRDAIFWFSDGTTVRGNTFHDNRYGVHMMYTDGMTIEDNFMLGNSVGAYLMYSKNVLIQRNTFQQNRGPSGYGTALKDMDGVTVQDNYYLDNRVGLFFDNSPGNVDISHPIERNVLAFNDIGVLMMPAIKRNILRENTFLDNLEQVGVKGGGSNPGDELGGNSWDGNYWSDYVGYDATGEGVGDIAYHAESLFENIADRQPNLRLFFFSPAQQAIDFAAKAFPVIKPKPKLTDEVPIISPVLPAALPQTAPFQSRMGWLAAGLLAGALAMFFGQVRDWISGIGKTRDWGLEMEDSPPTRPIPNLQSPIPSLPKDSSMLSIRNLTKRYPRPGRAWWSDETITAVDDLSFELPVGTSIALWGVNGAGKTTVLKCLLGLLASEGELHLNGFDLRRNGRTARRFLGYVPQELAFHNDLSVAESCRFYARLKNVGDDRIPVVLAQVGLTGQERKAVGALSGGMKQRLALALALLADPPVLLLDEPTSNLDAATRDDFIDLLVGLRNAGKTLLFTSHHADEVTRLAERVLILRDGRLVADGAPAEVLGRRQAADRGPQTVHPLSSIEPVSTDTVPALTRPSGKPPVGRGLSSAVAFSLEEPTR